MFDEVMARSQFGFFKKAMGEFWSLYLCHFNIFHGLQLTSWPCFHFSRLFVAVSALFAPNYAQFTNTLKLSIVLA